MGRVQRRKQVFFVCNSISPGPSLASKNVGIWPGCLVGLISCRLHKWEVSLVAIPKKSNAFFLKLSL